VKERKNGGKRSRHLFTLHPTDSIERFHWGILTRLVIHSAALGVRCKQPHIPELLAPRRRRRPRTRRRANTQTTRPPAGPAPAPHDNSIVLG
jgi:hypothetical protein